MTADSAHRALARALTPLVSRVNTAVTALKGASGSYWTNEPLTPAALERHVAGIQARGVCPIRPGESTTRVAVLDFDSHRGETPWQEMADCALQVAGMLQALGHRPVAWRSSGGRGIHLMLLWDRPQDAYSVRAMLCDALELLGLRNGARGVARGEVEVFPKQDEVPVGGFGNQFILPLAGASEPLDLAFGLEPMGRDWALHMDWPLSPDVPVLARPVRSADSLPSPPEEMRKVRAALQAVDNSAEHGPDYDHWLRLLFATHEATGGSDEGREAFSEWSEQNPRHDQRELDKQWHHAKSADARRGGGVTRGSLFAAARDAGWSWAGVTPDADGFEDVEFAEVAQVVQAQQAQQVEQRALAQREKFEGKERWKRAILDAPDELFLRESVCTSICLDRMLDDIDRELLAEALKTRLAALGSKLPIAACRKLLAPQKVRASEGPAPEWTDGWVYVTDIDSFYRLDSDEYLSMQSFNARFNRMLPPAEDGEYRKTASWVALEDAQIVTVTRGMYLPWAQSTFTLDGVDCVNTYRPSTTPKAAEKMTREGLLARDAVLRHIQLISGGRNEVVEILLSWMAHNVQHPGVKIRWAPLIKGIEGDGKTILGMLMAAVMGTPNVKNISPTVLGTDFTDWAHGACVGVLEEIRLTGHSRYDILNALKPYVTNNSVAIHPKGKAEFNCVNTMNYIAFTNYADALPLTDTDRRWMVLFTPFTSISDLRDAVGETGAYFDALFDAIEKHRGELRRWLLDYQIADSFKPNGSAPMTEEKGSMISMSVSDEEDAVNAALEMGGVGITEHVIDSASVSALVNSMDSEVYLRTSTLNKVLSKLGWVKVAGTVKWEKKNRRVWVKGALKHSNEWIRAELDKSLCPGGEDACAHDLFA